MPAQGNRPPCHKLPSTVALRESAGAALARQQPYAHPGAAPCRRASLPDSARGVCRCRRVACRVEAATVRRELQPSSWLTTEAPLEAVSEVVAQLFPFVQGSSEPPVEPPAGDCRFRRERAVSTCVPARRPLRASG